MENTDQIQLDQHFSIGSEVQGRIKLSRILPIFSTYFILPHYESTVQLHPSMSQRCEAKRDIFAASSYLIRYEKSFLFMNSHIGESSCHLLNLFTIYSNRQCKMGVRFDDSKSFWKAILWRVWKFHILLENKMRVLFKSSVTYNGNYRVWCSIVSWTAGILRLQDCKWKSTQAIFQRNTLIQQACDSVKAPYFRAFQDLGLSFHD